VVTVNAPAATQSAGGSTKSRQALTATQLNLVIAAAHKALCSLEFEVSPSKINHLVRRFSKALVRSRMTFHEFLSAQANGRVRIADPDLVRVIAYLDTTGETAVNHVMRERGF
jgi:hypothetical protein